MHLFVKTIIPPITILQNKTDLLVHQRKFFHFLVNKLVEYDVKSLILLGARTEVLLLKNYLAYHMDKQYFKNKVSYFFHHHKIFDLYDIWNNDIGRIIDLYFFEKLSLLRNFKKDVANHNQNDVLIGAAILSLLYQLTS